LAEQAGFSQFHFHRIFREFVGEPIKEYVRRLRLERGAYRLKISQDTVLHIALNAGFKTHETFTRAFAQHFGVTPSEFRADFLRQARTRSRRLCNPSAGGESLIKHPNWVGIASPQSPVHVEHIRPLLVAFVRYIGAYDSVLEPRSPLTSLWDRLFRWGNANGLIGSESLLIGIPQDDPTITPLERQRFDVCVQVQEFRNPDDNIGCQTISPGKYVVGRHFDSFDRLTETYARIYDASIASGAYQLRPLPCFEVYGTTRVNGDLHIRHTDVYMPVESVNHCTK
jgi:AraC family transcriptional regulator